MRPPTRQYFGSSFSPRFHRERLDRGGRTGGFGTEGNADVFRLLIEDGTVVRTVDLTNSEEWDSAPGWGTSRRRT